MENKTKVKVIEIESNQLVKGGRYIFIIDEIVGPEIASDIYDELERVLEHDKFTILTLPRDSLKIYQVQE
jgi:nucleoside-triphosphatase THEP1